MSEIMSLVYLKATGNILTYVTRRAAPSGIQNIATLEKKQQDIIKAQELEAIAGSELAVHYDWDPTVDPKIAKFQIPAAQLDVMIAKLDSNVICEPRTYFVKEDEEPAQVDSAPVTINNPTPTSTKITVTTTYPVPQDTTVWLRVQAQNSQDSRIATGTIAAGKKTTDISFATLPPATYLALAAVAGFAPVVGKFTVS